MSKNNVNLALKFVDIAIDTERFTQNYNGLKQQKHSFHLRCIMDHLFGDLRIASMVDMKI